jgi:hypothetical protein
MLTRRLQLDYNRLPHPRPASRDLESVDAQAARVRLGHGPPGAAASRGYTRARVPDPSSSCHERCASYGRCASRNVERDNHGQPVLALASTPCTACRTQLCLGSSDRDRRHHRTDGLAPSQLQRHSQQNNRSLSRMLSCRCPCRTPHETHTCSTRHVTLPWKARHARL